MTLGQAYQQGVMLLSEAGIADAQVDAFYLLAHLTGLTKATYYLQKETQAGTGLLQSYEQLLHRRAAHEPCQYLIGSTEFMGLPFSVTPAVLIPRQDTELLAETAIAAIKSFAAGKTDKRIQKPDPEMSAAAEILSAVDEIETEFLNLTLAGGAAAGHPNTVQTKQRSGKPDQLRVLDLCTGSGALAVSIKHFCPHADVVATDLSEATLVVAKANAFHNGADIDFRQGDLFTPVAGEQYAVIVSNPPYVTEDEYAGLMPEVKDFEPKLALTAGTDGLDCYRRIAANAPDHLTDGGSLLLEIGCSQAAAVTSLLKESRFSNIRVLKDLNGLDRVVTAVWRASF